MCGSTLGFYYSASFHLFILFFYWYQFKQKSNKFWSLFNYHNIHKTFINDCTFLQTRALFNVKYSSDNLPTEHFHSIIHQSLLRSFCNGVPLAFAGWAPQRSREKKMRDKRREFVKQKKHFLCISNVWKIFKAAISHV